MKYQFTVEDVRRTTLEELYTKVACRIRKEIQAGSVFELIGFNLLRGGRGDVGHAPGASIRDIMIPITTETVYNFILKLVGPDWDMDVKLMETTVIVCQPATLSTLMEYVNREYVARLAGRRSNEDITAYITVYTPEGKYVVELLQPEDTLTVHVPSGLHSDHSGDFQSIPHLSSLSPEDREKLLRKVLTALAVPNYVLAIKVVTRLHGRNTLVDDEAFHPIEVHKYAEESSKFFIYTEASTRMKDLLGTLRTTQKAPAEGLDDASTLLLDPRLTRRSKSLSNKYLQSFAKGSVSLFLEDSTFVDAVAKIIKNACVGPSPVSFR